MPIFENIKVQQQPTWYVPLILAYYYELMYEIDRVDPCLAASHCKYCMWKPAMQAQFLQSGLEIAKFH